MLFKIVDIQFLTQMPSNNFQGDPEANQRLRNDWLYQDICCDSEAEYCLEEMLDFVEDNSGMLVGFMKLQLAENEVEKIPAPFTSKMPSVSGMYPKGWIWERKVEVVKAT
jgi:hypothetical protein